MTTNPTTHSQPDQAERELDKILGQIWTLAEGNENLVQHKARTREEFFAYKEADMAAAKRTLLGWRYASLAQARREGEVAAISEFLSTTHKIIDNYSIHTPRGYPKGTVARRNLHKRLDKLGRQLQCAREGKGKDE